MKNIHPPEKTAPAPASPQKIFTVVRLTDLASRLFPATFFLMLAMLRVGDLINLVRGAETRNIAGERLHLYADIGAQASVILFLSLMVVLFVIRTTPIKKAEGIFPRVAAILGTFFMSIVTVFPRANLRLGATITATLLTLFGTVLSIFVLSRLGRSFSLMAEARKLVTTGPYSIIRHPLYLAEEIAMLGTAVQFFSFYTAVIFVIHLLVQVQRMKNEEVVLRKVYPEYIDYQARTARLIPGIY